MDEFAFVTSLNEKYYNLCGKEMLERFEEHMGGYPLYLYNEDFEPDHNVILQGWNLGDHYEDFVSRHNKKKDIHIVRFSKKAFSIIHAMDNVKCKKLIWIDADCFVNKTIPLDLLQDLSPRKILSSHFNVWHTKNGVRYRSCETGFFILNKGHKQFTKFADKYKHIYYNDITDNLRRFYDGDVYGEVLNQLPDSIQKDLNPRSDVKSPISRSILKEYLCHYKSKGLKSRVFDQTQQ